MNIILYSNKVDEYLRNDNVIDYDNESIIELPRQENAGHDCWVFTL